MKLLERLKDFAVFQVYTEYIEKIKQIDELNLPPEKIEEIYAQFEDLENKYLDMKIKEADAVLETQKIFMANLKKEERVAWKNMEEAEDKPAKDEADKLVK